MDEDKAMQDEEWYEVLGGLDELNCSVGVAKSFAPDEDCEELLTTIQDDICLILAEIGSPEDVAYKLRMTSASVTALEEKVAQLEQQLEPLEHFIIPEGTKFATALHCARAITRRVERRVLSYGKTHRINHLIPQYLDQLATFLFCLARLANKKSGIKERAPRYCQLLKERRDNNGEN